MLLTTPRAAALDAEGDLVLLADQDRSRWDRRAIAEGAAPRRRALRRQRPAPTRSRRRSPPSTRRRARRRTPTGARSRGSTASWHMRARPGHRLNRAVAVAMADGPAAGLDADRRRGRRARGLPPSARRPRRPLAPGGRADEAADAYKRALELAANGAERAFLERRLQELGPLSRPSMPGNRLTPIPFRSPREHRR